MTDSAPKPERKWICAILYALSGLWIWPKSTMQEDMLSGKYVGIASGMIKRKPKDNEENR